MKNQLISCFLLSISLWVASSCVSCAQVTEEPAQKVSAIDFALSLGMGWNLGNNLDAHYDGVSQETGWGNPAATQKTFDAVAKAGFKSVRIPITWMGHIGNAPAYKIDDAWMNRVAEVVGYAHKAGLKVIINIHHDGFGAETDAGKAAYHWLDLRRAAADETVNERIKQQLTMMWIQIATRFQNDGDWLMFETLNEIQDGKWGNGGNLTDGGAQYRVLNEWNQVCVYAIRSTGGNNETRFIGIPGYVANPNLTVDHLVLPEDVVEDRLLVAVHAYDPWDYAGSGKYSEWGHTGKDVVPGDGGEMAYVQMLNRLYNRFVRRGIPVYFGEFGCVHRATDRAESFRIYYLKYICKAMRDRKMAGMWWDNGSSKTGEDGFGLINHGNGKFIANGETIVRAMVDTWNNSDPAFTLDSIYQSAPK